MNPINPTNYFQSDPTNSRPPKAISKGKEEFKERLTQPDDDVLTPAEYEKYKKSKESIPDPTEDVSTLLKNNLKKV